MPFSLDKIFNYEAYRRTKEGWDEAGGRTNTAVSEDDWNRMTPQQRLQHWGGGQLMLKPGDDGYDELAAQTRGEPGRNIFLTLDAQGTPKPGDQEGYLVDPGREFKGDGFFAHSEDNQTPGFQHKDDDTWDYGKYAAVLALIMSGGAAAGAFGAAGAGVAGAEAAALGAEAGSLGAAGGFDAAAAAEWWGGLDAAANPSAGLFGSAGAEGATGLTGLGELTGPPGDLAGPAPDLSPLGNVSSGNVNPLTANGPTFSDGNVLSQLNQGRRYVNGARTLGNLLGNDSPGGRSGMPSGVNNNGGFDLGSLLGMLGLGRNAFGNGLGTAEGALALGDRAADRADPWGSSGRRGQFSDIFTPEYVQNLLRQDPEAIKNDPGYKFQLEQGTNAINVGDAAQGTLHSGNRLYELQDYGQGLATRFSQQRFNNNLSSLGVMGNLAGVNAGSPGAAAEALWQGGRNAANIRNGSLNDLFRGGNNGTGNLLGMLGNGASGLWNWLTGNGPADLSNLSFDGVDSSLLPYLSGANNADFTLGDYDIDFGDVADDFDWGSLFG